MRLNRRAFAFTLTIASVLAAGTVAPFGSSSQEREGFSRAASTPPTRPADRGGRDLSVASPESVGISSERLRRLDAAMKRLVDDKGGQFGGVRLLAPRTVEMMRTNHVNADALKTMAPGTGWGMDFQVVMDAAAAGDSVSNGTFSSR